MNDLERFRIEDLIGLTRTDVPPSRVLIDDDMAVHPVEIEVPILGIGLSDDEYVVLLMFNVIIKPMTHAFEIRTPTLFVIFEFMDVPVSTVEDEHEREDNCNQHGGSLDIGLRTLRVKPSNQINDP